MFHHQLAFQRFCMVFINQFKVAAAEAEVVEAEMWLDQQVPRTMRLLDSI
jgi:hypothetical protein